MGQGTEAKTRPEPAVEIQEKGEVFFYRPKVNRDEAHSLDDVQRMDFVLRPESAVGSESREDGRGTIQARRRFAGAREDDGRTGPSGAPVAQGLVQEVVTAPLSTLRAEGPQEAVWMDAGSFAGE